MATLKEELSATQTEFLTISSEDLSGGYSHDFTYDLKYARYHNIKKIVLEKAIIPKTFYLLPSTQVALVAPFYKDAVIAGDSRTLVMHEEILAPPSDIDVSVQIPVGNYNEAEFLTTIQNLLNARSAAVGNGWTYTVTIDSQTGFLIIAFAEGSANNFIYYDTATDPFVSAAMGYPLPSPTLPIITSPAVAPFQIQGTKVADLHGPRMLYLDVQATSYGKLDKLMYDGAKGQAYTYAIPFVVSVPRQFIVYQSSDFSELKLDQRDLIDGIKQLRFTLKDSTGRNIDLWGGNVTYVLKIIT